MNPLVVNVISIELVIIITAALLFIIRHALTRWWRTPAGRQLMAMAAVNLVETIVLLLVVHRTRPHAWLYVILFGISAAVWVGWVVTQARAGHRDPSVEDQP